MAQQRKDNSVGLVETRIIRVVEPDHPLELVCGRTLAPIDVAYETYGTLSPAGDNAILICHALSGDAHVAGVHSGDARKGGWCDSMVGPGKGIDTDRYFVICSNVLGGCGGTTGPSSINPQTGTPYGLDFPIVTIHDMVTVQKLLLERLGVHQLLAAIGGSLGGMQVLQWMIDYPGFIRAAIPIATTTHLSAQSIAFDAVGRNAILGDGHFRDGQYHDGDGPDRGLAIARMIGHITYLSEEGMREKFGRTLRHAQDYRYDFNSEFSVETYLDHQGQTFVERFDANSYLYITKASDYFDLQKDYGSLRQAFAGVQARTLVVSFDSDWLFTPSQSHAMVDALLVGGKDVSYAEIESSYGHDAFLLETQTLGALICCFLQATASPGQWPGHCPHCAKNGPPLTHFEQAQRSRVDYELIESLIEPGSTVLDVGCGDGELLAQLRDRKGVVGEGIEREPDQVLQCVCKGLPVLQYNIDHGLPAKEDHSVDVVILSQTVQTLGDPRKVLLELLRVGKKVIVSFPNFAYWRCRLQLGLQGIAPVTRELPFAWYNSPNIHFFSLRDFDRFCRKTGVTIEQRIPLVKNRLSPVRFAPNLLAEQAIYVTSR
jgi:homoserine O-acetyltransferase/O-succinyltransferase